MPVIAHQNKIIGQATNAEALVKDTVGWTGKNVLKNAVTTQTINDVTFTVNDDGSVTANGTASADATLFIQGSGWNYNQTVENFLEEGKTYVLSDGVNTYTGDKNVPNIRIYGYTSSGVAWSYGEITPNTHTEFTVDATMKACHISVYIRVPNGQSVSNLTFYPMIRKADIIDSTYEPYHDTVKQELQNKTTGHIVKNNLGTSLVQRGNLQFSGRLTATDDSSNDKTVVALTDVWTTPVSCLVGDTDVTISNANIHTTSTIIIYYETTSGSPIGYSSSVVTEGQIVITFNAELEEAASIKLQILN